MFRPVEQSGRAPLDNMTLVEAIETTLKELDRLGQDALALAVRLDLKRDAGIAREQIENRLDTKSDNQRQQVATLFGDGRS